MPLPQNELSAVPDDALAKPGVHHDASGLNILQECWRLMKMRESDEAIRQQVEDISMEEILAAIRSDSQGGACPARLTLIPARGMAHMGKPIPCIMPVRKRVTKTFF